MQTNDLDGYRIFEGELQERELTALRALIREGIDDDSDARFLFLALNRSLQNFAPRP